MNTELILKYIRGEVAGSEKEEIIAWINGSEANKKEFVRLKNAWSLASYRYSVDDKQVENAWWVFNRNLHRKIGLRKIDLGSFIKYAAVLIIAFGAGLIGERAFFPRQDSGAYIAANMNVIDVPPGQSAKLTLSDGSEVYLNSGTKISYPDRFSEGKRVVSLIGEAFFDVSKDKENPFIVETNKLDLKVYGTSFNVEAYKNTALNVTLVEGSLGLNSKQGQELVIMKPGENAGFDPEEEKITLKKVDTRLYTSWRHGIITFRNVPLYDIIGKIERWYNVDIEVLSEGLKDQTYSGTLLKSKPVDQILEALSLTASFTYEIDYRPNAPSLIRLKQISDN